VVTFNSFPVATKEKSAAARPLTTNGFQFFPSCYKEGVIEEIRRAYAECFQFFPSCYAPDIVREAHVRNVHLQLAFNSFPVATHSGRRAGCAVSKWLSILSQLLRGEDDGRNKTYTVWLSILSQLLPADCKALGRLPPKAKTDLSILSQLLPLSATCSRASAA